MASPLPLPTSAHATRSGALHAAPSAGLDEPFELLAACHERVKRSLALLLKLIAHAEQHGPDAQAADAARDVLRYFNLAAPLHHEDEERHLLPLLYASERAELVEAAEQMSADHLTFRALWAELAIGLQTLADGQLPDDLPRLRREAESFATLHDSHLALEDKLVFPAAASLAGPATRQAMSEDMAARRGVNLPR